MKVSLLFVVLFVILSACCANGSLGLRQRKRWFSGWLSKLLSKRCLHQGSYYKKGEIFDKQYNTQTKTCTALKCGFFGIIQSITVNNCRRPTTPPTPTTRPRPLRCFYKDKYYKPNTEISRGRDGNRCYVTYCDSNGKVVYGHNFHCSTTVTPTTTPPSTTPPSTPPPGCFYNGQHYPPDTEISRHQYGNCETFTLCDGNGQIIAGDSKGCFEDPTTTPTFSTTSTEAVTVKRSVGLMKEELKTLLKMFNRRK